MATKYSLRKPLIPDWFEEIELVTAVDLLALLTYHQKCGSAVQLLHLGFSWIEQHHQNRNAAQLCGSLANVQPICAIVLRKKSQSYLTINPLCGGKSSWTPPSKP
ncbi:hypothetical protein J3A83DRAFT_4205761, partial [Scleroderma citrinum]